MQQMCRFPSSYFGRAGGHVGVIAFALTAAWIPLPAWAQVIAGQAADAATGSPLRKLQVYLLRHTPDGTSGKIDSARTNDQGLFQLMPPGSGVYQLSFGPMGGISKGPVDTVTTDTLLQRRYLIPVAARGEEDPYLELLVERPAVPLSRQSLPRYPPDLRQAGVEGSVVASFIVDTTGRVERGSFRTLKSTDPAFTAAVENAVLTSRYRPAEIAGIRVRSRVIAPFDFTITR
jgi:TonB family protein